MRRFELGMTLNYAGSWGVAEGVREFFQNALDEEKENPENKMSFFYDAEKQVFTISNAKSKLTPKTLLMGSSSKKGKDELIGEHGEGYKVATVVLLRNGVTVRIYNNESNEVWESKVVKSKRYNSEIVCFDIKKEFFNKKDNLVIELIGITPEMYSDIVKKNLWLQEDLGEVRQGEKGTILMASRYCGDIFVEGLYVCHKSGINWGYNFKANIVNLDRDRGLVDTFDLKWAIAKVVAGLNDADFVINNLDNSDLRYISQYKDMITGYDQVDEPEEDFSPKKDLSDRALEKFYDDNGTDAVPVSNNADFNYYAKIGARPIMVETQVSDLIYSKPREFSSTASLSNDELKEQLNDWWSEVSFLFSGGKKQKFESILAELNKRL